MRKFRAGIDGHTPTVLALYRSNGSGITPGSPSTNFCDQMGSAHGKMTIKFVVIFFTLLLAQGARSDLLKYGDDDEDHHDTTVNQMLVPRSHQEDATLILNNLLKEYDKTLRPDIGMKPTVINVGIYVNSIGPVSSIDMVMWTTAAVFELKKARKNRCGRFVHIPWISSD
ncbi:gamma-aminobutyric acid receptor subunit gamma-3-like [Micropterus salmoides]|uniref:gamma-aminobutyric acid receptor subunit gamma-3-like n=1 Tax=Micropterus salmoides TaxID=27706 RepID=UPI0018EAD6A0|nr:gamma-aminobutyric acid receptor subunit gamma-3-like [Micropterus salmoides]